MQARCELWGNRLVLLTAIVIAFFQPWIGGAIFLGWLGYLMGAVTYWQCYQGPSLRRGLGFEGGDIYGRHDSGIVVTAVTEDGIFARAGFREGDVLPDHSHTELHRLLHRNRGRMVTLDVVDGDCGGPPFHTRPRRTIPFVVPTIAAAPPTRDDVVALLRMWCPFVLLAVGLSAGWVVAVTVCPSGPLWAQIGIGYVIAGGFMFAGLRVADRNSAKPT